MPAKQTHYLSLEGIHRYNTIQCYVTWHDVTDANGSTDGRENWNGYVDKSFLQNAMQYVFLAVVRYIFRVFARVFFVFHLYIPFYDSNCIFLSSFSSNFHRNSTDTLFLESACLEIKRLWCINWGIFKKWDKIWNKNLDGLNIPLSFIYEFIPKKKARGLITKVLFIIHSLNAWMRATYYI